MIPLSVLDLSPVVAGSSGAAALRNSIDLAALADRLGYARYWVAEHHNLASIASSAPEIMIGQIAAATTRIRVGSGGVMLPNHAPLMVAERFKVLEALFLGRIDLGLGRARTDPVTSYALRRRQDAGDDDFLERFQELLLLERRGFPDNHPFHAVHAMRRTSRCRRSGCSVRAATARARRHGGLGFSFAHHFHHGDRADVDVPRVIKPRRLDRPYAILACAVVCAETDAEAERLAATLDLNWVRRARGEHLPLASPEDALSYPYSPIDRERIGRRRTRLFVGAPATVLARLTPLIEATKADELMVTTMIYDHAARRRSYELLAQAFGLAAA